MKNKPQSMKSSSASRSKRVPKLRFPEFQDAPEWEETTIGDEATILKGKGISKADLDSNGSQPCIRYGELYTHYGEVIQEVFSRTSKPSAELFLSKKNDVIIPASGETKIDIATASCVMHERVALGGDLNVIRSKVNGVFLSYYLNGPKRFEIARVAQGDTVVHLYPSQLQQVDISLPKPAEQQRIAECLSSLDEWITAEAKRLDALKDHKKSLMQQLFPAEGETTPKLRFPEFQDAPEWEKDTVGQVIKTIAPPKKLPSSDYLRMGIFPIVDQSPSEVCGWTNDEEAVIRKPLPALVFGDHTCTLKKVTKPFAQGADGIKIFTPKKKVQLDYLFQFIQANPVVSKEYRRHFSLLKEKVILYPELGSGEQKRIADCLSSLDEWIAVEAKRLDALKDYKKGLMQQLFPSGEEGNA